MRFHPVIMAVLAIVALAAEAGAMIPPPLRAPGNARGALGSVPRRWLPGLRLADSVMPGTWDDRFDDPGPDGTVFAMARIGRDLYVGGEFERVGNVLARNIARWDGQRWHSLGDGENNGVNRAVTALLADGDSLFVGGQFDHAGALVTNNLAIWRSASGSWGRFGGGLTGDDDAGIWDMCRVGKSIYIAGKFSAAPSRIANNIARWDGTTWYRLGSGLNGHVSTLAVGDGRYLYAGGKFTNAGGVPVRNLAVYDMVNGTWADVGGGVDSLVGAIAIRGNDLFVGGHFWEAGSRKIKNLAIWNRASLTWTAFPLEITRPPLVSPRLDPAVVNSLVIDGSKLYIGGIFRMGPLDEYDYCHDSISALVRWDLDHEKMERLGVSCVAFDHMLTEVNTMMLDDGLLYFGGRFPLIDGYESPGLGALRLADERWISFGSGVNGASGRLSISTRAEARGPYGLRAMAAAGEGLILGGYFTSAGGSYARNIARYDGAGWHPLGDGLGEPVVDSSSFMHPDHVDAVTLFGTDVIAGGRFRRAGAVPVANIARWDGSAWSAMGSLGARPFDEVTSVVVAHGELFAAGRAPDSTGRVARWTGSDFEIVGTFDDTTLVLAVAGDALYACGSFTRIDGAAAHALARYEPATRSWRPLDLEVDGRISAIVEHEGKLYVGGSFPMLNGAPAASMAMWDGEVWSPMGEELGRGSVDALAVLDGHLYAGGSFDINRGAGPAFVAMWDGARWRQLDRGLDGPVRELVPLGSYLVMAGDFTQAGLVRAHYLTRWLPTPVGTPAAVREERIVAGSSILLGVTPNPASSRLEVAVRLKQASTVTLEIHDATGRRVLAIPAIELEAGSRTISCDVGGLPSGRYDCRVTSADGVASMPLVIAR